MSFEWAEYLAVAEQWMEAAAAGSVAMPEAWQRSAVSRAYYAAFATARNRLRDFDGISVEAQRNVHVLVCTLYEQHPDLRRNRIGVRLRGLRAHRNRCDYDDEVEGLPELTLRCLIVARWVLSELRLL
jgi:hypothetical protein